MRYFFFLFVLLDKSIISSLSSQVSRSSTSLFLPLPSRPLPTRDPHTPRLGHCAPDPVAFGQLFKGPGAFVKVGCRHAGRRLFLFVVLFFQPTLEQREKPGSTHKQIQSKETERQRFRGRSPERWRQGGRMPQMARPLNGWNQVFITLSRLGRMFGWMAFAWTLGWLDALPSVPAIVFDHVC